MAQALESDGWELVRRRPHTGLSGSEAPVEASSAYPRDDPGELARRRRNQVTGITAGAVNFVKDVQGAGS